MKKAIENQKDKEELTPVDVLLGRAAMVGFLLGLSAYLTADIVSPGLI